MAKVKKTKKEVDIVEDKDIVEESFVEDIPVEDKDIVEESFVEPIGDTESAILYATKEYKRGIKLSKVIRKTKEIYGFDVERINKTFLVV